MSTVQQIIKKGIAGIGVGFDYMIRNNFLDIEDDICEDFDGRMYRAVKYDPLAGFQPIQRINWLWAVLDDTSEFPYARNAGT